MAQSAVSPCGNIKCEKAHTLLPGHVNQTVLMLSSYFIQIYHACLCCVETATCHEASASETEHCGPAVMPRTWACGHVKWSSSLYLIPLALYVMTMSTMNSVDNNEKKTTLWASVCDIVTLQHKINEQKHVTGIFKQRKYYLRHIHLKCPSIAFVYDNTKP